MNSKFDTEYIRLIESTKQRLDSSCWKGYTKKGTKTIKKDGKKTRVNNCVKTEETFTPCDHCEQRSKCEAAGKCLRGEIEEAAKCTGPTKKASSTSKGKKYMKCVKDGDGYKRIHWGQKGAKASSGNSKRKKAFRARHKCSSAKRNTPRGQACKDW